MGQDNKARDRSCLGPTWREPWSAFRRIVILYDKASTLLRYHRSRRLVMSGPVVRMMPLYIDSELSRTYTET